jgi:hypothetical protein
LLRHCAISPGGCWIWQRGTNTLGYGVLSFQGQRWMAHRLAWVLTNGAIPEGQFVCHKCDTPGCCNPAHFFLGDHTTNVRDMIAKRRHYKNKKTHCLRGHPLDGDNLYEEQNTNSRKCKTCCRIRTRLYAGWPKELAETMGPTPKGLRPVGGKFPRKNPPKRRKAA